MDIDNSVGIDCGTWGWAGQRRAKEENSNRITIKNKKIKCLLNGSLDTSRLLLFSKLTSLSSCLSNSDEL